MSECVCEIETLMKFTLFVKYESLKSLLNLQESHLLRNYFTVRIMPVLSNCLGVIVSLLSCQYYFLRIIVSYSLVTASECSY